MCPRHYAAAYKRPEPPPLTQERAWEVVDYDPVAGVMTRKAGVRSDLHGRSTRVEPKSRDDYLRMEVDGRRYLCHRLAWLMVHGHMPEEEIDHINGNRHDLRIENLRKVSRGVNAQNKRKPAKHNKSGFLGVSFAKDKRKWVARIMIPGGPYKCVGYFETPEAASAAYIDAKRKIHEGCTL